MRYSFNSCLLLPCFNLGSSYVHINKSPSYIFLTMLSQVLIHLSILIFKAEFDRLIINKGVPVPHKLWICLLAPITVFSWYPDLSLVLIHASLYWIVFDIYLNLRRNLPYDYIGKGSGLDNFLFWFKSRGINVLVPKVALLLILVILGMVLNEGDIYP